MTDFSNWKEQYEKDQAHRRLCFARFCWVRKSQLTPSKKCTWEERFEEMEGISLTRYAEEQRASKKSNGQPL